MAGRAGDDAPQGLEGFAHETLRGQTAVLLKARDVLHPHVVLTGEHMTFAVGDPEDSLAAARRFLAEQVRSGRCALSYEAQLPGESTRTLIVEAHEVGLPHSVRFGRRFRRTRLTRRCRLIGEPFEMEPGAPLLVDPAVADAPGNGDEIPFPDELLQPEPGRVHYYLPGTGPPTEGTWAIEIPLRPFGARDKYDPMTFSPGVAEGEDLIETSIRLDFIDFQTDRVEDLAGRTFTFPTNPEEGYIDGSIYLIAAHNPVDVHVITFGEIVGDDIEASFDMRLQFEFEVSGFKDRDARITTSLRIERLSVC